MKSIILETENVRLHGTLNHTVAAQEFEKRLPMMLTLKRDETDYYTSTACGVFEPNDIQVGWRNGDILLWRGCFALNFGGEETSKSQGMTMVIGHTDEYLKLKDQKETIKLIIRANDK